MKPNDQTGDGCGPRPDEPRPPDDGLRFLSRLMDELAERDPEALDGLIAADPDVVERYASAGNLRGRVRAALAGGGEQRLTEEQRRTIDSVQASLAAHGQRAAEDVSAEPPGILTSLTRQLPAEKACELYRKIAPVFVYQVLRRLDETASLRDVHAVVDHLCSEEVQQRLQAVEHARDGILEAFREVLGRDEIARRITRNELERLLAESGAMSDLLAMENCIRLARSRAG